MNTNSDLMLKGVMGFKTNLMTLFNRLMIQGPEDILLILKSDSYILYIIVSLILLDLNININDFFVSWFKNMNYLSSKNAWYFSYNKNQYTFFKI